VWSSPAQSKTWRSTMKTGILLAKDDPWSIAYVKRCHACQIHVDFIHQAPRHLHPITSSRTFDMWGIDVVGPISPPSSKGHRFILSIIDYSSKWAEAIPLREVKTSDVIKFIKHHVVYRFGVPWWIIHDNGPQFVSQAFQRFCNKFRIQSVSLTTYYLAANGLQKDHWETSQEIHHEKPTRLEW